MTESERHWAIINKLLAELHSAHRVHVLAEDNTPSSVEELRREATSVDQRRQHESSVPQATSPSPTRSGVGGLKIQTQLDLEQVLFAALEPAVMRAALGIARRYSWPRSVGDSVAAIAEVLAQGARLDLLQVFRHGRPAYIEEAYIWQVVRTGAARVLRHERQTPQGSPLHTVRGIDDIEERQPGVDEAVAAKVLRQVPIEVREQLSLLFRTPSSGIRLRSLRRRLIVLLHTPFISNAGSGVWGLGISSTELAGLLGAPIPTITNDRQWLAAELSLPTWNDPHAWFGATRVGTRLVVDRDIALALLDPPSHRAALAVLWPLLRLIQVDGLGQRLKLAAAQGSSPNVRWRVPGGTELWLEVEAYGLWAGDRVTITRLQYPTT